MRKPNLLLIVFLCLVINIELQAQYYKITGKVLDKHTSAPLTGVAIILTNLNDTIIRNYAISDADGSFSINQVSTQSYRLKTYFIGYKKTETIVTVTNWVENVGQLFLIPENKVIKEVIVTGQSPAAVQKGDTTEMDANAYKTTKDASAEDLVQKMPTVSVDNTGTVKAQGETVQKVLVDGKPFFGDDPTVALRNLPAEVIDKVQIYNELSDQAKLTGFDDGNTTKTMNIVTKKNNRNGIFGKLYAGYGTDEKYQVGENLNFFNDERRISIISLSNNINQQNFSPQDLLGLSGGSGSRGNFSGGGGPGAGGNFMVGQQNGISSTNSIGLNYSDAWGSKVKVTGSYFFNNTKNNLNQLLSRQYIADTSEHYNENDTTFSKNSNHRFNGRLEYSIDSMNTLILVPRLSFQTNNSNASTLADNLENSAITNSTQSQTNSDASGYSLSNNLTFRHRFLKKGRTTSISITTSDNYKNTKTHLQSETVSNLKIDSVNQQINNKTKGYTVSTNLMYTEPAGQSGIIQVNYNNSITRNNTDKYNFDLFKSKDYIDTALSNTYKSDYISNSVGLGYRIQIWEMNGSMSMNYQMANLSGSSVYPSPKNTSRHFNNLVPMAFLRFKFSNKNNLMLIYRTNTNVPSISQLQDVVDNSNSLSLTTGNPNLKQEYSHNLTSRFSFANPDKSTNFFVFLNASYTIDPIGTLTQQATQDSTLSNGIIMKKDARISMPINLDHSWQFSTFMNYGLPLHFMKSNLNFNAGVSYSETPGKIDNKINYSNNLGITPGIVLSSNVSENLDFTVLYFGGYNFVKSSLNQTSNSNYYSHSASIKFSWIFWKGIVWTNDITNQYYKGLSSKSYNQDYILWNMGLGKKLFANQRGEIKLNVYDLLNQNTVVNRSVTGTYIQDTRTNALKRYLMLTFTYNLRQFNTQGKDDDHRKFDHPPFDHSPHDHPPFEGAPPPS